MPLLLLKLSYQSLVLDEKLGYMLVYTLTPHQSKYKNKKISWLTCYKTAKLCNNNFKRPHLTCMHCPLRKVVMGKLPEAYPIDMIVFFTRKNRHPIIATMRKALYSLAGVFS